MSDSLYIMGVPNFANYEASTALIKVPLAGGPIEYVCIGEDRLTRIKHTFMFPLRGIDYCLRHFGLDSLDQVDFLATDYARLPRWLNSGPGYRKLEHDYLKVNLRFPRERILIVDHHDAHAASCVYPSEFDEAGVLVVDGMGSKLETQSAYHFQGDSITWNERGYDWGIGRLYSMVTGSVLPYGPEKGYGKVMGLAPYGRDEPSGVLDFCANDSGMTSDYSGFFTRFPLSRLTQDDVPQSPPRDRVMEHPYPRIAFEVQQECERQMVRFAQHIHDKTGTKRLCIAGGVALNGRANYEILRQTPIEEVWVQPGCSDTGIPFGLALWAYYQVVGPTRWTQRATVSMPHAYCGSPYSPSAIDSTLQRYGIEHQATDADQVAKWIADGQIVAVFDGGSEYGPRALGHRSILADPRRADTKDRLNASVKLREGYRPYAPVVLREFADEYFDFNQDSPYMLIVADVRPEKRDVIPSVTHVDGTARIQTVTKADNGAYYDVVKAFYDLTGVPVLLNTSFNINREPIVETPLDALVCAFGTSIDWLIMEGRAVDCGSYRDAQLLQRLERDRKDAMESEYEQLTRKHLYDYNRDEMTQYLREENVIADWHRDYRAKYELENLMVRWRAENTRVLVVGTSGHTACLLLYIPEFPTVNVAGFVRWDRAGESADLPKIYPEPALHDIDWGDIDEVLVSSHEYQREISAYLSAVAPSSMPIHALYDDAGDSLLFVLPSRWPVLNPEFAMQHGVRLRAAPAARTASNIDFDFQPSPIEMRDRYAVIVNYHDVRLPTGTDRLGGFVSPDQLAGHVASLRDKFEFARVQDLVDPTSSISESSIVLTFDDGLRGVAAHALPVLRELSVPGSVYVCARPYVEKRLLDVQKIQLLLNHLGQERFRAAFYAELERQNPRGVERDPIDYAGDYVFYRYDTAEVRELKLDLNYRIPYARLGPVLDVLFAETFGRDAESSAVERIYLSLDDIKRLVDAGWEVGAHTSDHKVLPRLTYNQQRQNLDDVIQFLAPITGTSRVTVAYPYGFFNNASKRTLKEVGALAGLTMGRRMVSPQDLQARWEIPRYDVNDCFDKVDGQVRSEILTSMASGD